MNLEKLKDSARKFEQKEDWRKAIEVYLKAIQQIESGTDTSPDLSLYNRVGDLYLKINDTASAVRSYERAVDLYADQGFFNNAIALCGKILRVNPGRTQTYLKLAQLHARKNVVIEAKRNLVEFLERMNALGQLDQAFHSVKEFADQFSGSQEIRLMLVELLRAASREEEALEQLAKMAGGLEPPRAEPAVDGQPVRASAPRAAPLKVSPPGPARRGDLVFLDTGLDLPTAPPEPAGAPAAAVHDAPPAPPEGLETTETVYERLESAGQLIIEPLAEPEGLVPEAVPLEGLERGTEVDLQFDPEPAIPGLEFEASPEAIELDGAPLDELEQADAGDLPPEPLDGLLEVADDLDLSLAAAGLAEPEGPDLDLEMVAEEPGAPTAGLPLIEAGAVAGGGLDEVADLETRILDDPDNPDLHRELADRLLLAGDLGRAGEELLLSLDGYERAEDWASAAGIADRLVAIEPDAILHHQKRVELAFRTGERAPLLEAYLALGDALGRAGATDKALAVYRRVLEHDPANARAGEAVTVLTAPVEPPPPPPPSPGAAASGPPAGRPTAPPPGGSAAAVPPEAGFVDLGSMIIEESGPRDTRMRIDRREPQHQDEQREFKEILEQFKRGIDENLESDDYEAHYDLGIAFKEMGLLDEAIAEFQKALRAPEGKLRTSEALGSAFYAKGQFPVAEAVLRRAVESVDGGDEAKIGLIYWLGRSLEAQGRDADAIASYQRAMAVDIRFMDLSERIQRLTAGRRP